MGSGIRKKITSCENDIKDIWRRLRKRDFSGNRGLAVKNSVYQIGTTFVSKIGALFFTIILARLLMAELFGLYSLALSTILIFTAFSELGVGTAVVTFISIGLGKKKSRANAYLLYLGKIKIVLTFIAVALLLTFTKFISDEFYQKPIFLALIAGALYLIATQAVGFLQSILVASNYFRGVFWKEAVFQAARIILIPLIVFFALEMSFSDERVLGLIIFFLAVSFVLTALFLLFDVRKVYSSKNSKKFKGITKGQKNNVNKFIFATAVLALSGTFFGNIDRIMLGRFVDAEFIGYYTASFSLVGALTPLIGFAAVVLLPIFSKMKGKALERGFRKSIEITLLFALGTFVVAVVFAKFAVLIAFGEEYLPAVDVLRVLSVILFLLPMIAIYQSYYLSKGKPWVIAKMLIFSTVINVLLNYFLINYFLRYGDLVAVYGATIATLVSQGVFLVGLGWQRK